MHFILYHLFFHRDFLSPDSHSVKSYNERIPYFQRMSEVPQQPHRRAPDETTPLREPYPQMYSSTQSIGPRIQHISMILGIIRIIIGAISIFLAIAALLVDVVAIRDGESTVPLSATCIPCGIFVSINPSSYLPNQDCQLLT